MDQRGSLPFHQGVFDDVPNTLPEHNGIKQPYRCLESVLPYLRDILSPTEASEMLEIFFNEEHSSVFKTSSPYMLAHVLYPPSVLHWTDPRPISPALLAVIFFCVAQTADMRIFDTPGARERMSVDLYRLSLNLLEREDPDNYFRTSGKYSTVYDASSFLKHSLMILQMDGSFTILNIPVTPPRTHPQPRIGRPVERASFPDNSAQRI
jgi:hypothetical protein